MINVIIAIYALGLFSLLDMPTTIWEILHEHTDWLD